jgi:O-antigen/teichoic acid export membrane protein
VLVPWLFGARWEPAVVLAQILAVAGMATTIKNTVDPLILATGRPRPLMIFNIGEVAVYVVMLIIASSTGDLVLICATVAGFRVLSLIASYWLLIGRVIGASLGELVADAGAALLACVALAGVALPMRLELALPTLPLLAACAAVAFPVYGVVLWLISPRSWDDILMVLGGLVPRLRRRKDRSGGAVVAVAGSAD